MLNAKHKTVDLTIAAPAVLQYRVYLPTSENKIAEIQRARGDKVTVGRQMRISGDSIGLILENTIKRSVEENVGEGGSGGGNPTMLNVRVIRDGRGDPSYEDRTYSDGYTGKHNFCHAKTNLFFLCIFPR